MTDNFDRRVKKEKRNDLRKNSLNIGLRRQLYDTKFPFFQMPKLLGSFSVDGNRLFHNDRSQLKFFNSSRFKNFQSSQFEKVHLDLNIGMSKVERKLPSAKDENLDHMLRWILSNKKIFQPPGSETNFESLPADFVCFRGLLTTLMITLYENSQDWEIWAVKLRNTIYLCSKETQLKQEKESRVTDRDARMSSWGFKFEQYMQTDFPTSEKAQVGIPKIICGFRDDDGIVLKISEYSIDALPKMMQDPFWLPNVCMNFLDKFLSCVKETVTSELRVYKFLWPLRSPEIFVEEDSEAEVFLPDWFLTKIFKKNEGATSSGSI